jgi:two-component system, LytTR family, sensor histidine kinase LytS
MVQSSFIWAMKQPDWTRLFTRPYKVITQIVFWVLVFILYILLKEYPQRMSGMTLFCLVLQEVLELAIPCYTQNLLILPFFKRRQWLPAIFLYLVQLVILVFGIPYVLNAIGWVFKTGLHLTDVVDWRGEHIAFSVVAFTVIASLTKLGLDRLILDKTQKENELRHLKAQLNPHFLFNTLNNLYGLSVAESKQLPGLMLKLSDLLRYSLYDTTAHYVALQKEIDYLENYIELERIRLSGDASISFEIRGNAEGRFIAPLLMIVFLENAFKHFSAKKGEKAFIRIELSIKDDKLQLDVSNSIDPGFAPVPTQKRSGGLGLENVRQRLNLLYQGQYHLTINKDRDIFATRLVIELT